METWRRGDVETWGRGDVKTWERGDVETWRQCDVETWRREEMETIRYGYDTIRYGTRRCVTIRYDTLPQGHPIPVNVPRGGASRIVVH